MYKGKKILGIIPARGDSKGLPRKNILPLAGKPLIAWTIDHSLSSKYLDKFIVTTDDDEIAEISKQHGAEVPFIRPKELAGDTTPVLDVIAHTIDFFKSKKDFFDYVALLEPTSPLREKVDIDNSVRLLIDNETEADSLVSVGEVHMEHPSIVKRITEGYVKPYVRDSETVYRRQDLDKVYFPYGVIYLSKLENLIEHKTFYQERAIPYFIKRWQNYEVDDIYDLICIEAVLNRVKEKG